MLNSRFYSIEQSKNRTIYYHYVLTFLDHNQSGCTHFKTKWLKNVHIDAVLLRCTRHSALFL